MTPFEYTEWPCPAPGGGTREEIALAFDKGRSQRVLILPAWFDEANKMRRLTVEVMRQLDMAGIDCILPDLPGCNESTAPLRDQTLVGWRIAASSAASHYRVTHVLAIRAGALLAPEGLPGWHYAPLAGRKVLRAMIRARTIAAREAGVPERSEDLQEIGRTGGIELAGWHIGADMFSALETAEPASDLSEIEQAAIAGPALWLRAVPGDNSAQADALAAIVAVGTSAS